VCELVSVLVRGYVVAHASRRTTVARGSWRDWMDV